MSNLDDVAPGLETVITEALRLRLSTLHVCLPGRVESYDKTRQTAVVQPVVGYRFTHYDGSTTEEHYPALPEVPVAHQRWGSWFVHGPLNAGDSVMLVFGEASIRKWLASGVQGQPPTEQRFDLSDAIAMPVDLYPDNDKLNGAELEDDGLVLGKKGGTLVKIKPDGVVEISGVLPAAFEVALAGPLKTMYTTLVTGIKEVFDKHTHVVPVLAVTGSSTTASVTPAPSIAGAPVFFPLWDDAINSDKLKVSG